MVAEPFNEREGQIRIDLPGAHALFTTVPWGDVRESHAWIGAQLGVSIARAQQVHGDAVLEVSALPPQDGLVGEGDAILTARPGTAPMVLSADCVPVLIAGSGAVAAVHAGWKGLYAGVIERTAERLRALAPDATLQAAIGPAAGVCCYAVGEELHARFAQRGLDLRRGQNLDLKAIAALQLKLAGVATVHDVGLCTICADPARLFSYRRDGPRAGRQGALVWLS
ncbi:MAG: polyphenol oxidase family protein [Solirubrobacteraceae bacterium]